MHVIIRPSKLRLGGLRRKPEWVPPEDQMAVCKVCAPPHGPYQWGPDCEPKAVS